MIEGKAAIAVVGPDRSDLNEDNRACAQRIGTQLGLAGYVLVTRCGPGVSQIAAESALAADGQVVAVASGPSPGEHIPPEATIVEAATPLLGLQAVLDRADAAILVAPDLESLALLCQIWSYGMTPDAPYRQVVLVGAGWRDTVKVLADAAGLDARMRAMVSFAETPDEAIESLRYYIAPT